MLQQTSLLERAVVELRGTRGNSVFLPFFEGGRRSPGSGGPDGWTCRKWKTDNVTSKGSAVDMPECWTQSQLIEKTKTYPWLTVRNRKLGCKTCRNVKNIKTKQTAGIHLSSARINVSVEATGHLKSSQLAS